jgi:hypothetical protein
MTQRGATSAALRRLSALLAIAAAAVLAACGSITTTSTSTSHAGGSPPAAGLPAPVVDVTTLGCQAGGVTDCLPAITQAVQKVDAAGSGTVYFPAGHFLVNGIVDVEAGKPIDIAGAGRDQSILTEGRSSQLLKIRRDGVVVQDLTIDTQTNDGRAAIAVVANHTTLQRAHVLCGDLSFCLYYAGPQGATPINATYNTGNQVLDITIDDHYHDDGFSWSFQQAGTISNITHTGSRLALYVDKDVTVTNYSYTPGPQAPRGTDGFYLTPPSDSVTIKGFVSQGSGGIIGSFHPTAKNGSVPRVSSNIVIDGEQVLHSGNQLAVGDVLGLTIENCRFAGSSQMVIKPTLYLKNMRVQSCTIPSVQFAPAAGAQLSGLAFAGDTFPAFQPDPGQDPHAFSLAAGTPAPAYAVQGAKLENTAGLSAPGLSPTVS